MKAFIFDLDGIIIYMIKYHFLAWKSLCESQGYKLDKKKITDRLKVSVALAAIKLF